MTAFLLGLLTNGWYFAAVLTLQVPVQTALADRMFPEQATPITPWAWRAGLVTSLLFPPAAALCWRIWTLIFSHFSQTFGQSPVSLRILLLGFGPLAACNFLAAGMVIAVLSRAKKDVADAWTHFSPRHQLVLWSIFSAIPPAAFVMLAARN